MVDVVHVMVPHCFALQLASCASCSCDTLIQSANIETIKIPFAIHEQLFLCPSAPPHAELLLIITLAHPTSSVMTI